MNSFTSIEIFSIFLSILIIPSLLVNNTFGQTYSDIVSTRGFFNLNSGDAIQETELPSALSILNINNCPGELAIYVHGVWATKEIANEQTERVSLSLEKAGYDIPVIGFSWDSNTAFSLDDLSLSEHGWNIAKIIANSNGPLLGKFIQQFNDDCPNDKLRIIAHSLGSRVTLSAIQSLYENSIADNSKKITSVHLLGAAIDDEQISVVENQCNENNPPLLCSGKAIYSEVENFYSLYNSEDNMLVPEEIVYDPYPFYYNPYLPDEFTIVYPSPYESMEYDTPLGSSEVKSRINEPFNYEEYNVLSKIKNDNDADKKNGCDLKVNLRYYNDWIWYDDYQCTIDEIGDNHFGYMGYRSSTNPQRVSNSGAIECVVLDWLNENNYCHG
jgi:hypothetical protein